jgi:hypothetical protein
VWRSTNPDPPIPQYNVLVTTVETKTICEETGPNTTIEKSGAACRYEIGTAGLCDATTEKEGIIDKGFEIGLICGIQEE